ncbi:MAG: hypothetical protein ACFFBD_21550 [Candidatus Hodarchaeota archaeon]
MPLLKFDSNQIQFINASKYQMGDICYATRSEEFLFYRKKGFEKIAETTAARRILYKVPTEYLDSLRVRYPSKRKLSIRVNIHPVNCDITLYRSDSIAKIILRNQYMNYQGPRIKNAEAEKRARSLVKQVARRTAGLKVGTDNIFVKNSKGRFRVSLKTGSVYRLSSGVSVCVVIRSSAYSVTRTLPMADIALAKALTILHKPEAIYTI